MQLTQLNFFTDNNLSENLYLSVAQTIAEDQ